MYPRAAGPVPRAHGQAAEGTTFLATYWPAVVCLGALVALFAVYRAPPLVQAVGAAAGAVVALLAAWLLQQASGRPVLQALAACIMLFSAVAASFGCRCSPWTAVAAAVPLACAGGACLTPRGAARLSQAAFLATVFYASAIAFERLAGCAPAWGSGVPTFTIHIATLAVALAGVAVPSHPYAYLARRLLPTAIYECVGPSGVLSDTLLPENFDTVNIERFGAAVVLALLGLLGCHVDSISAAAKAALPAWLGGGAPSASPGSATA